MLGPQLDGSLGRSEDSECGDWIGPVGLLLVQFHQRQSSAGVALGLACSLVIRDCRVVEPGLAVEAIRNPFASAFGFALRDLLPIQLVADAGQ